MGEVIASWEDFSGGHWGNLGPLKAQPNQYGGYNAVVDEQGNLAPVDTPTTLTFTNQPKGQLVGMFWAWGSDGRLYYVNKRDTASGLSTTTVDVYRFTPSYTTAVALTTVTSISFVPGRSPDWALVADELYVNFQANNLYRISINGNTTSALAGTYGKAPAGRTVALYGERLVVGGIQDSRFGTVANRIVFSGDDTNNNPTDRTAWETLNYFDLGPPDATIAGLYPTRDALHVVLADQTLYQVTGTLGVNAIARRISGYQKGSGPITSFKYSHGVVDPSQIRTWLFNHAHNHVTRFNGTTLQELPGFGYIEGSDRTHSTTLYGDIVAMGGPDEFLALGVYTYENGVGHLVRVEGRNAVINNSLLSFNGAEQSTPYIPNRVVANDRYETVVCTAAGNGTQLLGLPDSPVFQIWRVIPQDWQYAASQSTALPGNGTSATTLFPFKHAKTNTEWEIDGFFVDFIPRPAGVSSSVSTSTGSLAGYVIGHGIPNYSRSAPSSRMSGVYSTSTVTTTFALGSVASDIWPNVRTFFIPARMPRVRSVRPVLTFNDLRIVDVRLLGKVVPGRTT